jgi:hypothetical protein
MGFWAKVFGKKYPTYLSDCDQILVKWDTDGKVYGPYDFERLFQLGWSSWPLYCKFINDSKWRKINYFFNIRDQLKASKDQKEYLTKYNINFSEKLLHLEAKQIIDEDENLRRQKEVEKADQERKRKGALPATPQSKKKMNDLGITFSPDITRDRAKFLIERHEFLIQLDKLKISYDAEISKKEAKARLERFHYQFDSISRLKSLAANRVISSESENIDLSLLNDEELYDWGYYLEELEKLINNLEELNVRHPVFSFKNKENLTDLVDLIESALDESEELLSEIEDRELYINNNDYKVAGRLNKKALSNFRIKVIEAMLSNRWDFDRDMLELVSKYLPSVTLKNMDLIDP